jgi:hypothetical protein
MRAKPAGDVVDGVAFDCEMVRTHSGRLAVARVAVVSHREEVLLDEWVHVPDGEVADYVTRISGVRAEHLVGARCFEAVQADVRRLIFGRLVVGHGVRADLKAMQLVHPPADIVDTGALDWGNRRCERPDRARALRGGRPSLGRRGGQFIRLRSCEPRPQLSWTGPCICPTHAYILGFTVTEAFKA